ncbi:MAG: hypothetical protein ACRDQ1_10330 [Sciscionella sp.]
MSGTQANDTQTPLERFKPTSGQFVGYAGLLAAIVAVGYCLFAVRSRTGTQVAAGAAFAAFLIWSTQLRPRATAYRRKIVLKNVLTDITVPYSAIEHVSMGQALTVWAEDRKHVCIGIGVGIRDEMRSRRKAMRRAPSIVGESRWREFSRKAEMAAPDVHDVRYQDFVVTRIQELVDKDRRSSRDAEPAAVLRELAWLPIGGIALTGVAFVAALVLL